MRKFIILMAALICIPAHADKVPASIQKSLKPFSIKYIDFSSGVLRVVMDSPIVGLSMYRAVGVNAACDALFTDKKSAARISKIEVLNSIAKQGYALDGGGKTCDIYNSAIGDIADKYIADHTVSCIAGYCRK